jgi:hypothetical protein
MPRRTARPTWSSSSCSVIVLMPPLYATSRDLDR